MTLAELRSNKAVAHIAPLAVFMVLMLLGSLPGLEWKHPSAPWWRQQPQQWIYPLQTVLCLGLIAFWWRHYTFRPLGAKAWLWGVAGGVVGIALWILPSWWHMRSGQTVAWLGVADRSEPGFNPDLFASGSAPWWAAVVARFVRMTVAVALVEELFWRGFLWRHFAAGEGKWDALPVGVPHLPAIALTTGLMTIAHHPSDYAACLVWSLLVSVVAVQTRSLGACVVMHAVSNFLLGLYIMATKQWGLW
jgi:CAAX prenyl protease-like protein